MIHFQITGHLALMGGVIRSIEVNIEWTWQHCILCLSRGLWLMCLLFSVCFSRLPGRIRTVPAGSGSARSNGGHSSHPEREWVTLPYIGRTNNTRRGPNVGLLLGHRRSDGGPIINQHWYSVSFWWILHYFLKNVRREKTALWSRIGNVFVILLLYIEWTDKILE